MITKEMLATAVEKNPFSLVNNTWGGIFYDDGPSCGCALTHLYALENDIKDVIIQTEGSELKVLNGPKIIGWASNKFGDLYTHYFLYGFDGKKFNWAGPGNESYKIASKAYEDGRTCSELL